MISGRFYTEAAVKIMDDFKDGLDKKEVSVIFDDGKPGIVIFSDGKKEYTKAELLDYFKEKSKLYVKDTLLNKMVEQIEEDEERYEEIYDRVAEKTGLKGAKLNRAVGEEISKIAEEQIAKDYMIGRGKTFKIAGNTKEKDGKIVMYSRSIRFDKNGKPTMQGIYPLSVVDSKIPVTLERNREGQTGHSVMLNTALAGYRQIEKFLETFKATMRAKEEGKINANPSIFITFEGEVNKDFYAKAMELSKSKSVQELERTIPEFLQALRKYPNEIRKAKIKMPMQDYQIADAKKEELKADTVKKMLNTSVAYLKKEIPLEKLEKTVNDVVNSHFETMSFNTVYSLGNTPYGFFPQTNIAENKIFPSSPSYDEMVTEIQQRAKEIKKELAVASLKKSEPQPGV